MRQYPPPSTDTLVNFIANSVKLERIQITTDVIRKTMMKKEGDIDADPHAVGHFKAINYALLLAKEDHIFENVVEWLKRIHTNIMMPIAEHDIKTNNTHLWSFPKTQCGVLRGHDKAVGPTRMPNPARIPMLIDAWRKDLKEFDQANVTKITHPRLMTSEDIAELHRRAYQAGMDMACIKPFTDGSNRVSRVVENLIRLHFGLPWKIIEVEQKDSYLDDLQKTQKNFPY